MKIGRLRVDIPDDWEDKSIYAFVAPSARADKGLTAKASTFRSNLVITAEQVSNTTLEQRTVAAEERLHERYGSVPIEISDGPTVRGRATKRLRLLVVDKGDPLVQIQWIVLFATTEVIVTFTSLASAPKSEIERAEGILLTLDLI